MKPIAIIPARGGSKRIPKKNIKPFLGKPIIEYTIKAALDSDLFSEVMVSTDEQEIVDIAIQAGATVPFLRSEKTANDFAHIGEVLEEVIAKYKKQGKEFSEFCCLFATAPFITPERLQESYELLMNSDFDSVFPVLQFDYPIQRALKMNNGNVSMFNPEHLLSRSQDLEPAFHDSGQYYWCKTKKFLEAKVIFSKNAGAIVIKETEAHDIDTLDDWKTAEIKYKILNSWE